MGAFASRQVILLPFPFSDLSASKLRPALVLADVGKGDWVLCQITSNAYTDPSAVELNAPDFSAGGLQRVSYARPGKLLLGCCRRMRSGFREAFADKMQTLTEKLGEQMAKGVELDQLIRQKLGGLGYEF